MIVVAHGHGVKASIHRFVEGAVDIAPAHDAHAAQPAGQVRGAVGDKVDVLCRVRDQEQQMVLTGKVAPGGLAGP